MALTLRHQQRSAMKNPVNRLCSIMFFAAVIALLPWSTPAAAQVNAAQGDGTEAIAREAGWPRVVNATGNVSLATFEPQVESWDGAHLIARSVVQVQIEGAQSATHYGVVAFEARTLTDKSTRVVSIEDVRVRSADFPSATPAQSDAWRGAIANSFRGRLRTIALDRLEAEMAVVEVAKVAERGPLRNEAPRILFSSMPAVLVAVDGEPRYAAMQGTPYERLVNTRPLVLRDSTGAHYLKIFDGWMRALSLTGPWQVLASPPKALATAFQKAAGAGVIDPLTGRTTQDRPAPRLSEHVPTIVVSDVPTELIVTEGPSRFVPVSGTGLQYVENTTGTIFKDAADNRIYVLIAGRWFRAATEKGPWEFVPANALPSDFARIPDDSPKENAKASVAGTVQAREAAIAAQLPQTAAVRIVGTKLTPPRFDGAPAFRRIEGTELWYVANSPTAIIRTADERFFAVENGVWFVAAGIQGPWAVAQSVPAAIYSIPTSSPLHYVTYVRVYAVTPSTVYVGYSPGYTGAFVDPATGVVIYGTGYAYSPWVGSVWYGAPVTYGYGATVAYTPWTGWAVAFGMGWAWGAATVATGWGWGPYPYWGPWAGPVWGGAAYGPRGGAVAWGPGGWAGYSGNVYSQWGARATVSRAAGGYNAWTGNAWAGQVGSSYNSRTGIASAGQRGAVQNVYTGNYATGARGVATGPAGNVAVGARGTAGNAYMGNQVSGNRGAVYDRATGQVTRYGAVAGPDGGAVAHVGNDVYAGKDGRVYRNTGDGWQQHTPGGGWQSGPGAAPAPGTANIGARGNELDSAREARSAGQLRTQNLQQSSVGMRRAWQGGGGFRGGGRRR
ncbi:autotransporter [Variovorax sp. GB1R11]|uniref:autotransporter n=1 Tax=Variovorax sp. GB1R11 TaxID=3443741 RepID=UPI003F44E098